MNYLKVTLARRARDVAEAENKLLQEKNKYVANLSIYLCAVGFAGN